MSGKIIEFVIDDIETIQEQIAEKVINDQLGIEILGSKNKSIDDLKVLKTITNSIKKINKSKNIVIGFGITINDILN